MTNHPTASLPAPARVPSTDDAQLLRRYVAERSQEAFAELVRRHVNVVYFAALRRVGGDAHLADDVAQSVFADLARKAAALQDRTVLTGWLYTSTRFAAAQAVRSEQRRRTHEQEAQSMHQLQATPDPDWNQLRPVIDDALDELSEHDREAVLLRFFENLPLAEVGARFSLSADAARMRVDRALDKLRGLLAKRGIASTSAALATAFVAQSGLSAPAGLVPRILAGPAGQAGVASAATFTLWKILVGAAVGIAGIGWWAHEASVSPPVSIPAQQAAAGGQGAARGAEPDALKATQTVVVVPDAVAASAGPSASASRFGGFTDRQKAILKTLWEHRKIAPDAPPSGWSFRPGPATSAPSVAEFDQAAAQLQSDGLVAVNPPVGRVSLTDAGEAFCWDHAAEIDAYAARPGFLIPAKFSALPKSEKDILKTLWAHGKISPDHPPFRWGFKLSPDAPNFAAFEAAVAGLHEVNGLVGVSAKVGIVYLTDRGQNFCQTHADEIDAYPLPAREFQPLTPETQPPAVTP